MRAGYSMYVQNASDWGRLEAWEAGEDAPPAPAGQDYAIWQEELELVRQVEEWGFDSVWCVEHHFTPYTMVPAPLQLLAHVAGFTERIDFGTMVVVLPWHQPIRVVEQLILLDTFLGEDRDIFLGVGRGLGRREFGGFGVDMDESRERFQEALDIIKLALTEDRFSYDGRFFQIPLLSVRPRPRDGQRILANLHGAWGSPQSVPVVAKNDLKPMVIPSKSWEDYQPELAMLRAQRDELGLPYVRPVVAIHAYCAETEQAALEGAERYLNVYGDTVNRHYEFSKGHLADLKSYQHYAEKYKKAQESGVVQTGNVFLDEHVWGTPDQCIERVKTAVTKMDAGELIFMMRFGGMPLEETQRSIELFAREVLPAVHELTPAGVA
jgi:alkanesulfonate monooxygenase SsuD/methylene tetrahydromethanopterin reductase-like flavin-dependent oxidoreductase (luciferase family)